MRLVAGPIFRHGTLKTTDTPVTVHLYSYDLNLGLYFRKLNINTTKKPTHNSTF